MYRHRTYHWKLPVGILFQWDEEKRRANLAKHGIDFDDAIRIFQGPIIVNRSDRDGEERWIGVGSAEGRIIAVVLLIVVSTMDHLCTENQKE